MHSLRNRDALFRHPAAWIFPVERPPCGGSINAHYWIQWRDRPVGTESECYACIQQGFPCIARLDSLRANDGFSPPAVVDCVVGLHGSNNAELCEAGVVLRMKVLRVLDARAPIGRTIVFFQAAVEIEYGAVGAIADGMDCKLESGLVGLAHRFIEMLDVEKIGAGEAALRRIVRERLIHPGSFRTKSAIGESFQVADAEIRTPKGRNDTGVCQVLPVADRKNLIDADGQLVGPLDLLELAESTGWLRSSELSAMFCTLVTP